MQCVVCGWPATGHAFVRPVAGGRRWALFFCDDTCKEEKLAALEQKGWAETTVLLGHDVFVPIGDPNELPAELR